MSKIKIIYFSQALGGGAVRVETGRNAGIGVLLMKGCSRISLKLGRCDGSRTKIVWTRDFAFSERATCS